MCGALNSLRFLPTSGRVSVNSQSWQFEQLKLLLEVRYSYWFMLFANIWADFSEE